MTQDMSATPVDEGRVGLLLINLGTPDAPTPAAVRAYLKEFLSDPRVVEIPQILWQPILRGLVLTRRPKQSAKAYQKVWTEKGSPLAANTQDQSELLQRRLGDSVRVRYAMRYGQPAIAQELAALQAEGCSRILVAALYPQYCGATTATAHDAVYKALANTRWHPTIRTLPPYFDEAAYIDALVATVERHFADDLYTPDHLLVSFHGMPKRTETLGDPYYRHCSHTVALLEQRLDMPVSMSFQSRFGRAEWLGPATDAELTRLAEQGVRHIATIAPGFSADCLETLEELAMLGREQFIAAGGERFSYIPCLNASDIGMDLLEALVRAQLSGWIDG